MVRLCGAAFGLFAFSITILLGLLAGNPANFVLTRALQAMLAFCLLGMSAGWVACRLLDEHTLRKHRELFPAEGLAGQNAGNAPAGSEDKGKPPSAAGRQGVAQPR